MSESSVRFKGVNGDLLLSPDWTVPLDALLEQLDAQLKSSDNFFAGSKVILELSTRALTLAELQSFQDVLARYGMALHSLRGALPEESMTSVAPAPPARPPATVRQTDTEIDPAAEPEISLTSGD